MAGRDHGMRFMEEEVTSRYCPENALNPDSTEFGFDPYAELAKAKKKITEMEKRLSDYELALCSAEQSAMDHEEEAKIANSEWDAAVAQSATLSARLEELKAAGKELANVVNTQGYTLVERVENVYPRFTEIAYESISFGASLALGAIKASTGQDYCHLDMLEDDIVEAMIANSIAMEPAGKIIKEVVDPHYPIVKVRSK